MFHPVGSQPPAVYWRRRFAVLATLVLLLVLLVLTVRAITSSATGKPTAAGTHHAAANRSAHHRNNTPGGGRHGGAAAGPTGSPTPVRRHHHHHAAPSGSAASSAALTNPASAGAPSTTAGSTGAASTSAAPPPPCTMSQLDVQAAVGQSTYHVGQKPVVMLQVTNTGSTPCVQDLADRQIVLKIYNGTSRVWGSHDCEIHPGTADTVLAVGHPVRVSMTWSGMTSQPGCTGARHQAGAGTYTLYPYLAGHQGKATTFSMV